MPVDVTMDETRGVLRFTVGDTVTADELEAELGKVGSVPGRPADTPCLWDLRAMDVDAATEELWESLVPIWERFDEGAAVRVALVVGTGHAAARRAIERSSAQDFASRLRVFRTEDEALDWLGPRSGRGR